MGAWDRLDQPGPPPARQHRRVYDLTEADHRILATAGLGPLEPGPRHREASYALSMVVWWMLADRLRVHVCGRRDCPNEPRPYPPMDETRRWTGHQISAVPLDPAEYPDGGLVLPATMEARHDPDPEVARHAPDS